MKTAEKLAVEHGVSKNTVERAGKFAEEVAAKPDAFKLALGRRYNRSKKANGQRGPEKLDQIEPAFQSTAAKLAAEHSVSEATVKRAGKFADEPDDAGSDGCEGVGLACALRRV